MFDMHYDLLSILYYCYLRNDFSYIENIKESFNKDNVTGVIANLYFMEKEIMAEELNFNEINVLEMFKISTNLFKKFFPSTKVIYSIEGCDYIKSPEELEKLYNLGLRNILLVWNNKNKYGSGNKSSSGLTDSGKEFIKKAVNLGISIDLSHMNKQTFYDTIELLKTASFSKRPKVIVSHSNCYDIYKSPRNLDDEQLKALKSLDVVMGLIGYAPFIGNNNCSYEEEFLKHIKRAVSILGIDHIGIATDDMTFDHYLFNNDLVLPVFKYETVKKGLTKLLKREFKGSEIKKILNDNIYNKLKENIGGVL